MAAPSDPGRPIPAPASDAAESLPAGLLRAVRALTTGTSHLVSLIEPDGTLAYVSPSVTYLLGYHPETLIGSNVMALIHPDDLGMAISMLGSELSGRDSPDRNWDDADTAGDYRLLHADGSYVPFEVLRNNFLSDPDVGALLVIGRPVVIRRALDDALSALAYDNEGTIALHKLAKYLDLRIPGTVSAFVIAGAGPAWITDQVPAPLFTATGPWHSAMASGENAVFVDVNQPDEGFDETLRSEAMARGLLACWCIPLPIRVLQVYSPAQLSVLDAEVVGCLVTWSSTYGRPVASHLGVLERVGGLAEIALRRRAATRDLHQLVNYDQVTGALSRTGFERLARARQGEPAMLIMLDLDGFKLINDEHGHPTGDEVLRITAQRVKSLLRSGDVICRLGGDEFLLRVAGTDVAAATSVADRIIAALENPLVDDGIALGVRASLGIAPFDPTRTYAELLSRADAAMYAAKRAGKGRWHVWRDG
jgi:diguanylate cyclase (GGDEF)-like protein/PAS domain S-box-containing protein